MRRTIESNFTDQQIVEAVLAKCVKLGDCYLWKGSHSGGRGQVRNRNGNREYTHRVMWEAINGIIPDDSNCVHTCENDLCCNIDHLEILANYEMIGTLEDRFKNGIVTNGNCWLWTKSTNEDGYGKIGYKGKVYTTHRMSWMLHRGEIPQELQVLHKCDVRNCVNPEHLFLGTQFDNIHDMIAKGRAIYPVVERGENNYGAKITNA